MEKNYLKSIEYLIEELISYARDQAGVSVEASDVADWLFNALDKGNIPYKYSEKHRAYIVDEKYLVDYDRDGIYVSDVSEIESKENIEKEDVNEVDDNKAYDEDENIKIKEKTMSVENEAKIDALAEILFEKISKLKNLSEYEKENLSYLEKIFKESLELIKKIKEEIMKKYKKMEDMQKFYDEFEKIMSEVGDKFVDLGIGAGYEILIKEKELTSKMKKILKELGISDKGDILIEIGLATADDNSPFIQISNVEAEDYWGISVPHLRLKDTKVYKLNKKRAPDYEFYPEYLWHLFYFKEMKSDYQKFKEKKNVLYELLDELKNLKKKKRKVKKGKLRIKM